MAKKKAYKKMTNAEKKWNKEFRAEMREKGILPPVKAKLNRKKFLQETFEEWESFRAYDDLPHLFTAINCMVSKSQERNITSEQVGVLKVLKIAVAIKAFEEGKQAAGETSYSVGELFEAVEPIRKL